MPLHALWLLFTVVTSAAAMQHGRTPTAPETFTSQIQSRTAAGALGGYVRIQIDRYTRDDDLKTMTDALKHGGYSAFLQALRKAPEVGRVEIGDVKGTLRWARQQATPNGRTISLVTDAPLYFVGGGRATPKPREGFELAIIQLTVGEIGLGTGTMTAAARVKPDGAGGVVMEDYADEPIILTSVSRVIP